MRISKLNWFTIGCVVGLGLLIVASCSSDEAKPTTEAQLDATLTPVSSCEFDNMIGVMNGITTISAAEAADICANMGQTFGGLPSTKVLRDVARVASVIEIKESEEGRKVDPIKVGGTLTSIIAARGQTDPKAMDSTVDVVLRAYEATDGAVTPRHILAFLRSSGDAAKTISDDGLAHMVPAIQQMDG